MIRQAISCDVCGAEKRQTNHWFVACESAGELRLSAWSSRMRQRAGTKHLCGQTCLHKLVDEFIAGTISGRVTAVLEASDLIAPRNNADASLASSAAYTENSCARLIPSSPASSAGPGLLSHPGPGIIAMPSRQAIYSATQPPLPPQPEAPPDYDSRRRRADAWERERKREQRGESPKRVASF